MKDFEYYFMMPKGDQAFPMIDLLDQRKEIIKAQLGDPLPICPVLADYLTGSKDFVSKKIANIMLAMDMEGVRILPIELSDRKGGYINNYYCIYVDSNTFEALDKEKSDYEYDEECNMYFINKYVLDKEVLKKIPLKRRLGWRLLEEPGIYLYHKSVIDKIKKLNPTGVEFINIEEYEGMFN